MLELRGLLLIYLAPSFTRALEGFLAQKGVVIVAARDRKLRQRRSNPGKIEIAFGRDALALLQSCLATFPSLRHLFRRCETPLAIGMQQSARDGIVDGGVVTQRGEDVMNEPAVVVDVARLLANDPGYAMSFCQLYERCRQRSLIAACMMQLYFDGEPFAESFPPLAEHALCSLEIIFAETGCDRPGRRTGQHLNSLTPLRYLLPGDARAPPRLFPISFLPRRELAHPRSRDERCDVIEPDFAPRQESDGTSIDIELGTDDRLDVLAPRLESESDYPAQIRGIGDANSVIAECRRAGDKRFR